MVLWLAHQHLNGCFLSGRNAGGLRTGEQPRAGMVEGMGPCHLRARKDATLHTERLGKRTRLKINLALKAKMVNDARTAFTKDALAVTVVNVNHGTVFLSEGRDLVKRGDVTVHREHAVRDDELALRRFVRLQDRFQLPHVVVSVDCAARFGEADAVDDGTVVQLVRDDDVVGTGDQGRNQSNVDRVAGRVDQGRFHALEFSDFAFCFQMNVHGTGNGTHRSAASPVGGRGFLHGSDDLRMGGQVEVIVGREHDGRLAVHAATGLIRALQRGWFPQQRFLVEFLIAGFHPRHVTGHGQSSPTHLRRPSLFFVSIGRTDQRQEVHSGHVQAIPLTQAQIFHPQLTDGCTMQIRYLVAKGGQHASNLPFLPFVDGELEVGTVQTVNFSWLGSMNTRGAVHLQFDVHTGAERAQTLIAYPLGRPNEVDFRHVTLGVGDALHKLPVGGQHKHARRGFVEPAHREHPVLVPCREMIRQQVKHRRFSEFSLVFVDARTQVPRGLVEHQGDVFLWQLQSLTGELHGFGAWVELEADVLDHRAVHGDFACPNRFLHVTLGREDACL